MEQANTSAEVRKIIHVDMDAFYASVEQRDNPNLQGKPVAVGGSRQRGVVAAASYEARKYGIHSAMASATAYRKCPHIIFVKPRFEHYSAISKEIRAIFYDYTDLVEPLSLDEAYLDVTHNKMGIPSATRIAKEIRKRIADELQLTASAGISINKFLAKVASDLNKPNGLTLIRPDQAEAFVEQLAIDKFHGIGKKTAEKMHRLGINHGSDLKAWSLEGLVNKFGKAGRWYYHIARAEDHRAVNPDRIRKSIGAERTFDQDKTTKQDMLAALQPIGQKVFERMEKASSYGKTLTLKVKFSNFEQITRSKTVGHYITSLEEMEELYGELMDGFDAEGSAVRLLGLSVSNLNTEQPGLGVQLTLRF